MFYSKIATILLALGLGVPAFAQVDLTHNNATLVRCTQNTPATGRYRYNVRVFQNLGNGKIYADLHAVDVRNDFGRSIFQAAVQSQVVSQNPRIVTFWTPDNKFILKVPAKYSRGNGIVDYSGPGLLNAGGVNYYMNCFSLDR